MKKNVLIKYTAIIAISITAAIAVLIFKENDMALFVKDIPDLREAMVGGELTDEKVPPDAFPNFQKELFLPLQATGNTNFIAEAESHSRAEVLRLKKALAGNMFIPGIGESAEERENRRRECIQLLSIGNRIVKNAGTPEEKKRYFNFKVRMAQDQIALIKYIIQRAEELERENGTQYLSEKDAQDGSNAIKDLESEMAVYQNKLHGQEPDNPAMIKDVSLITPAANRSQPKEFPASALRGHTNVKTRMPSGVITAPERMYHINHLYSDSHFQQELSGEFLKARPGE